MQSKLKDWTRFLASRAPRSTPPTSFFARLLLLFFLAPPLLMACPLCKEALFDPAQARQAIKTARGYAFSIGLLLGTPVLLISGIAVGVIRQTRRRRGERPNVDGS